MKTKKTIRKLRPLAKLLAKEQRILQLSAARLEKMVEAIDAKETDELAAVGWGDRALQQINALTLAQDTQKKIAATLLSALKDVQRELPPNSPAWHHLSETMATINATPQSLFPNDQTPSPA